MRVLGLVTARGGSKRLPGKNLRPIGGRSLLERTIDAALGCPAVSRVVVSTDDPAIAAAAREAGAEVPFLRPPHLASDEATSLDVVRHALEFLAAQGERPDAVALLQPTSPLRTAAHLSEAIALLGRQSPPAAVVGVTAARPASWLYVRDREGGVTPLFAPGAAPAPAAGSSLVLPNGAVYVASVAFLEAHGGFTGPGAQGYLMSAIDSVDVDTADDFALAEALLAARAR